MMVQLLIMGFVIFASSRNFTMVGMLALGINSGAYVAEIVRGGLMSMDPARWRPAVPWAWAMWTPCASSSSPRPSKTSCRPWATSSSPCFKDTSLITVIGGKELLYAAQAVGAKTYSVMFPYLGAAFIYLVLVMLFTWLQGKLERRLRQSDRR
jgi:polar amino acid transport system permease protein